MNTSYIYSATRASALATSLITEADIERLLDAANREEQMQALQESYLASYLEQDTDGFDLEKALEEASQEALKIASSIAPNKLVVDPLALRRDIHNLRVFMKGKLAGLEYEQIVSRMLQGGLYAPETIYEHVVEDTLYRLEPEFHNIYHKGYSFLDSGEYEQCENLLDKGYFACWARKIAITEDSFLKKHYQFSVDLFNLLAYLRTQDTALAHDFADLFVSGGTFALAAFENRETVLQLFSDLRGDWQWKESIDNYRKTGDLVQLELAVEALRIQFVKESRHDIFSSASIIFYCLATEMANTMVRMVWIARENNLSVDETRKKVHILYDAYK